MQHPYTELISTPNILQSHFKQWTTRGAESALFLVFNKDKLRVWLKYHTETTGTVQKTSDCMLPVGESPEKKIILSK